MTDDDIKAWVTRQVARAKLEIEIDICQAEIERLKLRLAVLQDQLSKDF